MGLTFKFAEKLFRLDCNPAYNRVVWGGLVPGWILVRQFFYSVAEDQPALISKVHVLGLQCGLCWRFYDTKLNECSEYDDVDDELFAGAGDIE